MASQHDRHDSVVLEILRIVRDAALRGEYLTAPEIFGRLESYRQYPFENPRWVLTRPDPLGRGGAMAQLLGQMQDLGLLAPHSTRERSSGFMRWRPADTWQPPPRDGDGDHGGPPPRENPEDPGDDGRGIREVLSHPVLFALDGDDFDGLLRDLFDDEAQS